MKENLDLSIVIPIYNEGDNIEELYARLKKILEPLNKNYEIIFVNDGSTDSSQTLLEKLRKTDNSLKIIKFRRNFGHHPATYAGFEHAVGEIVVTLDGDLQNPPEEIPPVVDKMKEGWDIVCGWRKDRKDPFLSRKVPSLIVNWLISRKSQIKIHDYGCFLRAYKNNVVKEISRYSTFGGWFPVLFRTLGYSVTEVPVSHSERGGKEKSHHSFFKRYDQFISIFAGVATKPFQLIEFIGMFVALFCLVGLFTLVIAIIFSKISFELSYFLLFFITLLLGILLTFLGLIGEYIVRMNYEIGDKPKYIIEKIM